MIIRRRKDRFIAEIVPNVPPETCRRPPVAAATGLPDSCQISPALLLRQPLFHILKNCCCCCSSMRQQHAAAAFSSTMQQHHAAAPCSSKAINLLLHLYLLAFFKFFSKFNIIFFFLNSISFSSALQYSV